MEDKEMKAFKKLLILGAAGLAFSSVTVYAQLSGEDIATQNYFHLRTRGGVLLCNDQVCPEPPENALGTNVVSNLFTFTHSRTPQGAMITQWNDVSRYGGRYASGSFTIEKHCGVCLFGGPIDGAIYVKFLVRIKEVPPVEGFELEENESEHVNFKGWFSIVGGEGFYSGIRGYGSINGTSHDHRASFAGAYPDHAYLDFVMLGSAHF